MIGPTLFTVRSESRIRTAVQYHNRLTAYNICRDCFQCSLTLSVTCTPHWSPRASSDAVSCSFSSHTWQFIIFTIFTITACIVSYSLRISFWTQDLALQQILSSIDLFFFFRTNYTDSRTMLNGCTGKCVRLSRPLVRFWTHFWNHCTFISFHFMQPLCSIITHFV